MLYKFHTKNAADCLMLKDLAQRIFDVIEKPLEDRGILLVEQLPSLISKLEKAIENDAILRKTTADEENNPKLQDRLGQRAHPFLKLLQDAHKNQDPVIWGA
jgi:hypothetical protein